MKEFFCYVADFGSVSDGDTNKPATINFDTHSTFQITHIRPVMDSTTTEARVTIQKGSSKQMSDKAIALSGIRGSNNSVLNLLEGEIVNSGDVWKLSADVTGGAAKTLQIQFWGYKY